MTWENFILKCCSTSQLIVNVIVKNWLESTVFDNIDTYMFNRDQWNLIQCYTLVLDNLCIILVFI